MTRTSSRKVPILEDKEEGDKKEVDDEEERVVVVDVACEDSLASGSPPSDSVLLSTKDPIHSGVYVIDHLFSREDSAIVVDCGSSSTPSADAVVYVHQALQVDPFAPRYTMSSLLDHLEGLVMNDGPLRSTPSSSRRARCASCRLVLPSHRILNGTGKGGCLHRSGLHTDVAQCGIRCAARLMSHAALGSVHWGCCGSVEGVEEAYATHQRVLPRGEAALEDTECASRSTHVSPRHPGCSKADHHMDCIPMLFPSTLTPIAASDHHLYPGTPQQNPTSYHYWKHDDVEKVPLYRRGPSRNIAKITRGESPHPSTNRAKFKAKGHRLHMRTKENKGKLTNDIHRPDDSSHDMDKDPGGAPPKVLAYRAEPWRYSHEGPMLARVYLSVYDGKHHRDTRDDDKDNRVKTDGVEGGGTSDRASMEALDDALHEGCLLKEVPVIVRADCTSWEIRLACQKALHGRVGAHHLHIERDETWWRTRRLEESVSGDVGRRRPQGEDRWWPLMPDERITLRVDGDTWWPESPVIDEEDVVVNDTDDSSDAVDSTSCSLTLSTSLPHFDECMQGKATCIKEADAPLVVVVGAGPVGLWTALQLRLRTGWRHIHVFEKRDAYARHHGVKVEPWAFQGMLPHPLLQSMAKEWQPRARTSAIEERLRSACEAIGIQIEYGHAIESLNDVARLSSSETRPLLCIAADGARSTIRSQMCREKEFSHKKHLGTLLQVKFQALGRIRREKSSRWSSFFANLPHSEQFFRLLPSAYEPESDTTPVTIFSLMLDESISEDVLHAEVSAHLHRSCPDGIITGSLRINRLPAAYHVASKVVDEQQRFVLVGDAAMGLPLEKGLAYGWRAANFLCGALSNSPTVQNGLQAYEQFFHECLAPEAVQRVERQYDAYVTQVRTAGRLRSALRGFAPPIAATAGMIHKRRVAKRVATASDSRERGTFQCIRCGETFSRGDRGGCTHSSAWHNSFGDCGTSCAIHLSIQADVGACHWGCCYSTNFYDGTCAETNHVV